jgi:hypothetical protein
VTLHYLQAGFVSSAPAAAWRPGLCHPGPVPVDPTVIVALEVSVNAAPDNVALRLHLAALLLESDRTADALRHATVVLERQPDVAGRVG